MSLPCLPLTALPRGPQTSRCHAVAVLTMWSITMASLSAACAGPAGEPAPSANASVSSQRSALSGDSFQDALACIGAFVDAGQCDWAHWSDLFETCQTYQHAQLNDGLFLDAVQAGRCNTQNWATLTQELREVADGGAPAPDPTDGTLGDTVACLEWYAQQGLCDWNHWSELYSTCRTASFEGLNDGAFLEGVKSGLCTLDQWPALCEATLGADCPYVLDDARSTVATTTESYFSMIVLSDPQVGRFWDAAQQKETTLDGGACGRAKRARIQRTLADGGVNVFDYFSCGSNDDEACCTILEKDRWQKYALEQSAGHQARMVDSLTKFYSGGAEDVRGVIINGDLTENGWAEELKWYSNYFDNPKRLPSELVVFPGLGNHDYQNGSNDGNKLRMLRHLLDHVKGGILDGTPATVGGLIGAGHVPAANFDFRTGPVIGLAGERRLRGSLSYSWDIEGVHFVQLNNYPSYTYENGALTRITSALDKQKEFGDLSWLEWDLNNARANGKSIVINMHDVGAVTENANFTSLLGKYGVDAIFAGHLHGIAMKYGELEGENGHRTPVFLSGSVMPGHKATPDSSADVASGAESYVSKGCDVSPDNGGRCGALSFGTYMLVRFGKTSMRVTYYQVSDGGSREEVGSHEIPLGADTSQAVAGFAPLVLAADTLQAVDGSAPHAVGTYTVALTACTENCGERISRSQCSDDDQCLEAEHCDLLGHCIPDRGNNGSCLHDGECQSGICISGLCAECDWSKRTPEQCGPNHHCNVTGDCIPDRPNNGSCSNDWQCQTGLCLSGFCAQCDWSKRTPEQCGRYHHCNVAGDCIPNRSNNGSCSENWQCQSNICISGLCAECRWGKSYDQCSGGKTCNVFGDCV